MVRLKGQNIGRDSWFVVHGLNHELQTTNDKIVHRLSPIVSNRGISIIAAVLTLIVLGIFGVAIVALVSMEHEMRTAQITKEKVFYAIQAGLEYGLREVDQGGYPIVTDKMFVDTPFTTSVNAGQKRLTVTSAVGSIQKTHSISVPQLAGDCLDIDTAGVATGGAGKTDLTGITIRKTCLEGVRLDKMLLIWNPDGGEKVQRVTIDSNILYDDTGGVPSGTIFDLDDYRLGDSVSHPIDLIRFSSDIGGKDMELRIIFTDTSQTGESFQTPS